MSLPYPWFVQGQRGPCFSAHVANVSFVQYDGEVVFVHSYGDAPVPIMLLASRGGQGYVASNGRVSHQALVNTSTLDLIEGLGAPLNVLVNDGKKPA